MAGTATLDILSRAEAVRNRLLRASEDSVKQELGQFFTPAATARLMASMFVAAQQEIRILDPGAGFGTLTVALVQELCNRKPPPRKIHACFYEIDPRLEASLKGAAELCQRQAREASVDFSADVVMEDFIFHATELLSSTLFSSTLQIPAFNCAILNPPYRKIASTSSEREKLRNVGIEATNMYAGFVALAIRLLDAGGEMVAITPRSFCNGPYFQPLRELLLKTMSIRRLHLFDARDRAFSDDSVLQENVILHAVKIPNSGEPILTSFSHDADDAAISTQINQASEVVDASDPQRFIHIPRDRVDQQVRSFFSALSCSLADVGLSVSTGPVVDFRLRDSLSRGPVQDSVPLLYPAHLSAGAVNWPRFDTKKPNAIRVDDASRPWLISNSNYVLVKRFSSKEERRRVVATVYNGSLPGDLIGLENHLNYFHENGNGLDLTLARGLARFLNSTLVDNYFRQFSGHTQVNSTDLRNLRYPSRTDLVR